MSYEPTLIIKEKDLEKHRRLFEKEQWSEDADIERVAKFLLDVLDNDTIEFEVGKKKLVLLICTPEFTSYNADVRNKLTDLDITYQLDW